MTQHTNSIRTITVLISLTLCCFACTRSHRPTPPNEAQNPDSASLLRAWVGTYHIDSIVGRDPIDAAIMLSYTVQVAQDSIQFMGNGYQTYFVELCSAAVHVDTLMLYYLKTIEGHSYNERYTPMARLYKVNEAFYLESPALGFETTAVQVKKD